MGKCVETLLVSQEDRESLNSLVRASSTPQALAQRARMILHLSNGLSLTETATRLGSWRKTVGFWRKRWLNAAKSESVVDRLSDALRSGAPAQITAEQSCAIIALACKPPSDFDLPLSHWGSMDLSREAVRQGIIDEISPRSIGRILKRGGPQTASKAILADAKG